MQDARLCTCTHARSARDEGALGLSTAVQHPSPRTSRLLSCFWTMEPHIQDIFARMIATTDDVKYETTAMNANA